MRRSSIVVAAGATAVIAGTVSIGALRVPLPWRAEASEHWQVLDRYCITCHNRIDLAGGVSFEKLDRNDLERDAPVWEAAVRKVRTGFMPPLGEPRPAH